MVVSRKGIGTFISAYSHSLHLVVWARIGSHQLHEGFISAAQQRQLFGLTAIFCPGFFKWRYAKKKLRFAWEGREGKYWWCFNFIFSHIARWGYTAPGQMLRFCWFGAKTRFGEIIEHFDQNHSKSFKKSSFKPRNEKLLVFWALEGSRRHRSHSLAFAGPYLSDFGSLARPASSQVKCLYVRKTSYYV